MQIPHMSNVEEIEAAVSEDDSFTLFAPLSDLVEE